MSGFGLALVWIDPNYFGSLCSNPNKIQTNDMVGGVMYFCRKKIHVRTKFCTFIRIELEFLSLQYCTYTKGHFSLRIVIRALLYYHSKVTHWKSCARQSVSLKTNISLYVECLPFSGLPMKKKFTPFSKYWGSPARQRMVLLTWTFGSRPKIDFYENLIF